MCVPGSMDELFDRESMGILSPKSDKNYTSSTSNSSVSKNVSSLSEPSSISSQPSAKRVIISECLCYVSNNIDRITLSNLTSTVCSFYTEQEISKAKSALSSIANNLECMKNRIGPNKKYREVADICEFFLEADKAKARDNLPLFVASNLSRIPSSSSEEMSTSSIVQRLSSLESELERVKNISIANNTEIASLKSSSANTSVIAPQPAAPVSGIPIRIQTSAMRPRLQSLASNASQSKRPRVDSTDEEGYKTVMSRKTRKHVVGKKTDCTITGAKPKFDIFVYHLEASVTSDAVSKFITNNGIQVHSIKRVSHADAQYASFKVNVFREHYDRLCGEDACNFWPSEVRCRPFIKPRNNGSEI